MQKTLQQNCNDFKIKKLCMFDDNGQWWLHTEPSSKVIGYNGLTRDSLSHIGSWTIVKLKLCLHTGETNLTLVLNVFLHNRFEI